MKGNILNLEAQLIIIYVTIKYQTINIILAVVILMSLHHFETELGHTRQISYWFSVARTSSG